MIAKRTTIRPMTAVRPPVDSKKLCNADIKKPPRMSGGDEIAENILNRIF